MRLVINKDFVKEYTNDVWRGFTLRQLISLLCGLGVMLGCMYVLNKWTGIPAATCVYIAVPAAVPVLLLGFWTYQDMSVLTLLREIWYSKKTAHLAYEAQEFPEAKIFTLESKKLSGISGKEWKRNKRLHRKKGVKAWDY